MAAAGGVFRTTIEVAAGAQPLDGAEAHLRFDPTVLQVTDDTGTPSTSISPGGVFEAILQNRADNTTGQIDFSAGTFRPTPPSGAISLATITFRALGSGTTPITFLTTGRASTTRATLAGATLPVTLNNSTILIWSQRPAGITVDQPTPVYGPPAPDDSVTGPMFDVSVGQ